MIVRLDLIVGGQRLSLGQPSRALHAEETFDPVRSDRTFRMMMSDYPIAVMVVPGRTLAGMTLLLGDRLATGAFWRAGPRRAHGGQDHAGKDER